MTADQFERQMRDYLRRDPFEPFVVWTDSNQSIVIDNPLAVALASGGAGYMAPEQIHFIESAHVVEIRSISSQAAS